MTGVMIIAILVAMVVASVVVVVVGRQDEQRREVRRRRFELTDTDQRVPLAAPPTDRPPPRPIEEVEVFTGEAPITPDAGGEAAVGTGPRLTPEADGDLLLTPEPPPGPVLGRFVNTPDGEQLLTTPPFALRETVMTKRNGRYALALLRRLPPWLLISPKVRLDSLLTPTSPDGRDPADWRQWRHRVRVRAIDLLLCDRRTWKPVLAIMIDRDVPARAGAIGGGKDRIVDEVLSAVGLPLVRGTGLFKNDWPLIRPYVEQATLAAAAPPAADDALHGGQGWDASAAITLLRMDDEKGWLLE